jgi:PKD repeat protein
MKLNSLSNITKYLSLLFLVFSTLPASAAPQVAVSASRTSCTAPCAVFFDATGTTSSTTSRPFHDVDYTWDFGDSNAGTWATTGRSKNSAKGAVASHVFEKAGTYQIKLSAKDSAGVSGGQATVTVADPNVTFTGAKTRCVSTSGNFSGCPAGAQQVTSSDLGAQFTWLNGAGGQRLLLRGGDSWNTSGNLTLRAAGPGMVGAYGTGKPTISTSVNSGQMSVLGVSSSNWVIAGLKFVGPTEQPNTTTSGISVGAGLNNVLLLGNEITRFPFVAAGHSWSVSNDSYFVVDNYFHHNGLYQGYFGGNRVGILGNRMEYTNASHIMRTWYTNKSVIGENILRFPSYVVTSAGRHALKMHTDRALTSLPSQYGVISGNTMEGSVYVVVIGPQNAALGSPEKIDNIVFDRNKILHSAPHETTNLLRVSATNVTIRNNVFDSTNTKYGYGLQVLQLGDEPVNNIHILNNVFLRTDAGTAGDYNPVNVSSAVKNSVMRNNIGYAPTYTRYQSWNESNTAASNNLVYTPNNASLCRDGQGHTGSGYCVNPNFVSTDPANAAYVKLNAGSPAIDKGMAMAAVAKDFWDGARPQGSAPDIGVHEYGSTASTTTPPPATTAPTADFTASKTSGAAPLGVTFTPTTTGSFTGWSWDYNGDGTADSSGTTTTNAVPTAVTTYNNPGTYTVSLTLTGPNGNVTKTKAGLITVTAPTTSSAPTANFTANATSGVAPLAVTFTSTSTGAISGYSWNFGDGTSSTAQNPAHSYSAAGTYTVSLTVTGSAGSNTATKAGYITVTTAGSGTGGTGATSGAPAGLVAAYGFEESSGTLVADASGQKNHGTLSGATRVTGKFGRALSFNGSNNWVTVKDSASLDASSGLTLEAWVYPKTSTSGRTVILKEKAGGAVYNLYSSEDANLPLSSVYVGGYRVISSKSQLPLNQWSHLAATYNGQYLRLYVNGVEVANRPQTGPIQTSGGALRIGGNSIWGEWFSGSIDEVRIYNRALTASEVQADMNKAVASATPPKALLGAATVGATVYPAAKGVATAFQATASATGLLTRVSVYPDASAASTNVIVGIYSDNQGHPGQRLGTASVTAIAPGQWNAIALPATAVSQGAKYWIALLSPNAVLQVRAGNGSSGGVMETSAQTGLTALPSSWTTGAAVTDGPVSAYGAGY